MDADFVLAERNLLVWAVEAVDGRQRRIDLDAEHASLLARPLIEEQIVVMQVHGRVQRSLRNAHSRDVVDVRMRQQNVCDRDVLTRDEFEQTVNFVAGIDEQALTRARARHHEAVLVKRRDRLRLDYDHAVILAILDDLMFSSKIRSAAHHAGVTVAFARSTQSALEQARSRTPSLVILDLNNPRTDPMGTITALKADAALSKIRTLGYVSHVDADTIAAARAAGADEVLARSAFVTHLADILAGNRSGA